MIKYYITSLYITICKYNVGRYKYLMYYQTIKAKKKIEKLGVGTQKLRNKMFDLLHIKNTNN